MPRNISFSLTTEQIRNRTKTVTRRLGWKTLRPGEILNACVKCMGLRSGEKIEKICQIRVVSVRLEELGDMRAEGSHTEAAKEGFPHLTNSQFVDMFCCEMGCVPWTVVTRIEFEYVD